jgi:hypothetical protein
MGHRNKFTVNYSQKLKGQDEEFYLFIRSHIELENALTLLPKLSSEVMLERISKYYSFLG